MNNEYIIEVFLRLLQSAALRCESRTLAGTGEGSPWAPE